MLTICYPDPNGNINISVQGTKDHLMRTMTLMGFEFLVMSDNEREEVRKSLDPNGTGMVKIDDFARYLNDFVTECTDNDALTEAFKTFDADNDNKLSMEEFEFFMTGFAKEYNGLMEKNMVQKMLDTIYREKLASEDDPKFDITEIVSRMKGVWAA